MATPHPEQRTGPAPTFTQQLTSEEGRLDEPALRDEMMKALVDELEQHDKMRGRWSPAIEILPKGSAVVKTVDNDADAIQTISNLRESRLDRTVHPAEVVYLAEARNPNSTERVQQREQHRAFLLGVVAQAGSDGIRTTDVHEAYEEQYGEDSFTRRWTGKHLERLVDEGHLDVQSERHERGPDVKRWFYAGSMEGGSR